VLETIDTIAGPVQHAMEFMYLIPGQPTVPHSLPLEPTDPLLLASELPHLTAGKFAMMPSHSDPLPLAPQTPLDPFHATIIPMPPVIAAGTAIVPAVVRGVVMPV
jgi:hypothetical protein